MPQFLAGGQSSRPPARNCGIEAVRRRHFCGAGTDRSRAPVDWQERPFSPRVLAAGSVLSIRGKCREFSMRNSVIFAGLGVALAAGTSAARAQTVETIVSPAAGPAVVAQAPMA